MSEQGFIELLKQKKDEAFEELVSRFGRRLFRVSFRILRNAHDAEDAVQETFLRVFQTIKDFREESSLYTWLYRIACNISLQKLRRRKGRVTVPVEPYLPVFENGQHTETFADWSQSPESSFDLQELHEFLEKCVEELPDHHRVAYILKDIEKFSEDQVAQILDITRQAAKNRVHQARLVIRKRVEDRFFKTRVEET